MACTVGVAPFHPLKGKQTEVQTNSWAHRLSAATSGTSCPMRGSDRNPADQSEVTIRLLTRRLVWVCHGWRFTPQKPRRHSPGSAHCNLSDPAWRCRRGRGKLAHFCAFSACCCPFMRFTSNCPERETQITEQCATWASLWAAPRSSPPGMHCQFCRNHNTAECALSCANINQIHRYCIISC